MNKFDKLQETFSSHRLQPYLKQAQHNKSKAHELYLYNLEVSEILYYNIHWFEITLRNKINHKLIEVYGDNWHKSIPLIDYEQEKLREISAYHQETQNITPELNLGFWNGLFKPCYDDLWRRELRDIFATERILQKTIYHKIIHIRKIRNRIAHYEPILNVRVSKNVVPSPENVLQDIRYCLEMLESDFIDYLKKLPNPPLI